MVSGTKDVVRKVSRPQLELCGAQYFDVQLTVHVTPTVVYIISHCTLLKS